jgi:uncharacterized protein (TIGR02266 family)
MRNGSSKTAGSAATRERRNELRTPARIEVRFQEASQAALAFRAYSLNFSVGGLCLRTRNKYAIGTELKLALKVARVEYQLSGVVAWERRGAIGVRFSNLQPEDRERLARLLAAPAKSSRR